MKDTTCDFCQEIAGSYKSTFQRLYGEYLSSRIIIENQHFICIPTIGQIVDGSLLILPKDHLFTLASIPQDQISAFSAILQQAQALLGQSIMFEHGCYPKDGHNCGVYHAHAHIVPVQEHVAATELLGTPVKTLGLEASLTALGNETEYALFMNSKNETFYLLPDATNGEVFQSQYFRRWIADRVGGVRNFDWNHYSALPEAVVIDIVRRFRKESPAAHVL